MIAIVRGYRVNGDSLSCWFAPDGALSTAMLEVGSKKNVVANQLPGLKAPISKEYLSEIGFRGQYDRFCLPVGRDLNEALSEALIFVETIWRTGEGLALSVASLAERSSPCPERLFLAFWLKKSDDLVLRGVKSKSSAAKFNEIAANKRGRPPFCV
jgi:hypothetical protein